MDRANRQINENDAEAMKGPQEGLQESIQEGNLKTRMSTNVRFC